MKNLCKGMFYLVIIFVLLTSCPGTPDLEAEESVHIRFSTWHVPAGADVQKLWIPMLEEMKKIDANLGGEQSGHTIFLDDCPTGDGILTSLKMLEVMTTKDTTLASMVAGFEEYPQILRNVPVSIKPEMQTYPEIVNAISNVEELLADSGRLNVRYSGTEPLARIMIEGESQNQIEDYAAQIAAILTRHLG